MWSARLVSICLLVVLACGTMAQIAALPTEWTVAIGYALAPEMPVFVNDVPYCIGPDADTLSAIQSEAASMQSKAVNALEQNQQLQITITIPFAGYVHEGTCDNPGALVGPIAGTLIVELEGSEPDLLFTALLVFDVGPGLMSYHSEAKFTGVFQYEAGSICQALKDVVSEYAFVRGTGLGGISLNLDLELLRLEPASGECSSVDGVLWLPTFVFGISGVAVGGLVIPANTLALVAPWMAVIGLVGIGTLVVVAKKHH